VTVGWKRLQNEELHNCTSHEVLLEWWNRGGWHGLDM